MNDTQKIPDGMRAPNRSAPGGPGILPRWTSSAKTGVGTALSNESHVWFTLALACSSGAILFIKKDFPSASVAILASLMVYVGSFAVGLGPVFWLMLSEIYPLRLRGRAMSVGTVANWSANLIVALSFLTLMQILGIPATFWLYGGVSVGAWLFAFFLVPETKGRSLEEIEAHWRAGKHPRAL